MAAKNPFNLPTEKVDLSSKGFPYPPDHILSQGFVEIMYPGALQEDILTNSNYLTKGTAVDKYLESILITDVSLKDFISGDKLALMIFSRILGFGSKYTTHVTLVKDPELVTFDLSTLKEKEINWELFSKRVNEFSYNLPVGKVEVKFKLLTGKEEASMSIEEEGMKKAQPNYSADTTLFLKYSLVEVNGSRDTKTIKEFVDRHLLQQDSRKLKKYIKDITPEYVWTADGTKANGEVVEGLNVPYTVDFFWPRFEI